MKNTIVIIIGLWKVWGRRLPLSAPLGTFLPLFYFQIKGEMSFVTQTDVNCVGNLYRSYVALC